MQFKRVRPSRGAFTIDRLPPGDYWLAAVDDALLTDWPRPGMLSHLRGAATRVTINGGERLTFGLVMRER
jgi:hypothetical protein